MKNKVDVSEDGTVQMPLSGDIDLWGKVKTFKIKGGYYRRYSTDIGGNGFNDLIPDTVTEIFFTDEIKPENASVIDVDADGDGGVIAWTENSDTIMKVSTQIKGMKVQADELSGYMFYDCRGLTALDLSQFDTQIVKNMNYMFKGCSGLTILTTGSNFEFVGVDYRLAGKWQNTAGETFTEGHFPSNVADTYTKIPN